MLVFRFIENNRMYKLLKNWHAGMPIWPLVRTNQRRDAHHKCKILVAGGGTAGCTMAAKFANKYGGSSDLIAVIEPNEKHYYQPLFTLIGGGIKPYDSSYRLTRDVLPKNVKWIKNAISSFQPEMHRVITSDGDSFEYEYLIIALGLQLQWETIAGLRQALDDPAIPVCSIYGPDTVNQVFGEIQRALPGTAYFTFPNSPVKCPGAPQKIAYIADDYWRNKVKRSDIKVVYNTALPVIFGVKKYADALWKVCENRDIAVNTWTNLISVNGTNREAVFQNLQNPNEKRTVKFSMLHVCPPMGTPKALRDHPELTNDAGFLTVDEKTLRHTKYPNIYGLGDCTNTPNSKTMAAIASQSKVVYENLVASMTGKSSVATYDGYASCPLVTGYGKCILAEFDYKLRPMETFPLNQAKESYLMYLFKKEFFPYLYWNWMLRGYWSGPATVRHFLSILKQKDPPAT